MTSTGTPDRPGGPGADDGCEVAAVPIDVLLARARTGLDRVPASELHHEVAAGALVVDTRPVDQRVRFGELPGALVVDRNVLEWRLDPTSPHVVDQVTGHGTRIVVVCQEGYSSSLAARTLRLLGLRRATDLEGGYEAWARWRSSTTHGADG